MNKKIIGIFILGAVLLMIGSSAFAVKPNGSSAHNGLNHQGKASQLYLYEKDVNWQPVIGGAWGKLTFKSSGFVFNGHGLIAGNDYSLINYVDLWPGTPATCLANGIANSDGNLHLSGPADLNGLGKIWLILSSDVTCGTGMTGWNPSEYLFEYKMI